MIEYIASGSSVLKVKIFSISQDAFLVVGSYPITGLGNAQFMAMKYRVNGFNISWTLNDPQIQLNTDPASGNALPLLYNGGLNYTDPVFMIYPNNTIYGSSINQSLSLSWLGAAFTPGGSTVDFTLYYVNT